MRTQFVRRTIVSVLLAVVSAPLAAHAQASAVKPTAPITRLQGLRPPRINRDEQAALVP